VWIPAISSYSGPVIKAGTRRFVAVVGVLAASVAVLAGGPDKPRQMTIEDAIALCRLSGAAICTIADLSVPLPPAPSFRELVDVPPPMRPATNGVPGCIRGPKRPVVGTTMPTLEVTYAKPVDASFELVPLDGSEESTVGFTSATAGEPVVWETGQAGLTGENGLEPGRTYRWRTTGASIYATAPAWSPWCEFTVAADLVDLRPATDVDTVRELRVDPVRRYPVTLTVREWRLVLEGLVPEEAALIGGQLVTDDEIQDLARRRWIKADVRARIAGRAAGRPVTVILTGNDWAAVAVNVMASASSWDQMYEEEPEAGDEGPRYWKVLDRISAELGGPAHPSLGAERRPVRARSPRGR
jgi:hypothetical protein